MHRLALVGTRISHFAFVVVTVLTCSWIANETLVGEYGGYTCSHCNGKRHLHMKVKERDECKSFNDDQVEACDYPCAKTNLDRFTGSPSAELQFYATQFAKGTVE